MNNNFFKIIEIAEHILCLERGNYLYCEYFVKALDKKGKEHSGYLTRSQHYDHSHIDYKTFVGKYVDYKWSKPEGYNMTQYKIFNLIK